MPICKFIYVTGWSKCEASLVGPLQCNLDVGNGAFREQVIMKQYGKKGSVDWKKCLSNVVLVYSCFLILMVSC